MTGEALAALRARFGEVAVVTLEKGVVIVLRRPTEAEAVAIADKATLIGSGAGSKDVLDNGDYEIAGCVVHPDPAALEELLEDCPRLPELLSRELRRLCKLDIEDAPELVTDELRKLHGRRLIGLRLYTTLEGRRVGDQDLVLRKLQRVEYAWLNEDLAKTEHGRMLPSTIAQAAKEHLIVPAPEAAAELFRRHPTLSQEIGRRLWNAAQVQVRTEQGKFETATSEPTGTSA